MASYIRTSTISQRDILPYESPDKILVIQVSPFPPEAGSDYHRQLAFELRKGLKIPVIVLAGLNYLNMHRALREYGVIEKKDSIIVYRAFWAPRITEYRRPGVVLRHIISSLKALTQVIDIARKHVGKVIVHFHYGPTTWPGGILGEHYPLGMMLAKLLRAKVIWTIHAFLVPQVLLREARSRGLPLLLSIFLLIYYMILVKLAAKSSHKIISLVDYSNAPITSYFSKLLGKNKIEEQVHPPFKPMAKLESERKPKSRIIIVCPGYIRREKGYHHLLKWLVNLKNKDPKIYAKVKVIIAGGIDRRRRSDIEYLVELIRIKRKYELSNVEFILKKLDVKEFHELLAKSDIIWCAYEKKYGPSGILAWARAYHKKVIYISNLWGMICEG